MKKLLLIFAVSMVLLSCKKDEPVQPKQQERQVLTGEWSVLFYLGQMQNTTATSVDIYDQNQTKIATLTPGSSLTNTKEYNCQRNESVMFYIYPAQGTYHPYEPNFLGYIKPTYKDSDCFVCIIAIEQNTIVTLHTIPISREEIQEFKTELDKQFT